LEVACRAIVGNGDALDPALFQAHRDVAGAGIERILEQFLDHGRWPIDDLAGRDLGDELIGQGLDWAERGLRGIHGLIITLGNFSFESVQAMGMPIFRMKQGRRLNF
jgi:hypothetical protein